MLSSIALKYARALIDVAAENGLELKVLEQLQQFDRLLQSHQELRGVYVNPSLPFSTKRKITEVLSERLAFDPLVVNFLLVALENGRIAHLPKLVEAAGNVLDQRQGVVKGQVFSPKELDDSVRIRLKQTIGNFAGSRVRLSFHEDPTLIGGLKLVIGSEVYDGSVRAQLEKIRKSLTGE